MSPFLIQRFFNIFHDFNTYPFTTSRITNPTVNYCKESSDGDNGDTLMTRKSCNINNLGHRHQVFVMIVSVLNFEKLK